MDMNLKSAAKCGVIQCTWALLWFGTHYTLLQGNKWAYTATCIINDKTYQTRLQIGVWKLCCTSADMIHLQLKVEQPKPNSVWLMTFSVHLHSSALAYTFDMTHQIWGHKKDTTPYINGSRTVFKQSMMFTLIHKSHLQHSGSAWNTKTNIQCTYMHINHHVNM